MGNYHPWQVRWSFSLSSLLGWGVGRCYFREVKIPSFKTCKDRLHKTLKIELEKAILPLCQRICQVNLALWDIYRSQQLQLSVCPFPLSHSWRAPWSFISPAVLQTSDLFHIYSDCLWKHTPLFSLDVYSYTNYAGQLSQCIVFLFPLFDSGGRFLALSYVPFTALQLSLLWALSQSIASLCPGRCRIYRMFGQSTRMGCTNTEKGKPAPGMHKWLSSSATRTCSFHFEPGMETDFTCLTVKPQEHPEVFFLLP